MPAENSDMQNAARAIPGVAGLREPGVEASPSRAGALAGDSVAPSGPENSATCSCIRKILVPTDFSAASAEAVRRAIALANQCHAALTILHVIDINARARSGSAAELMHRLWAESSIRMGQLAWSLGNQVEAQTVVEEGLPWEKIVEKSREVDLVILGKKRVKGRWRLFSGCTAQRVLETADSPVLLVPEPG